MSAYASTLPGVLAAQVEHAPDAPLLWSGGRSTGYADFAAQVDGLATAWTRLGISRGDRIAIAATNDPAWLVTYMATVRIGAVLVTLNVVYREREFLHMLGQSGARLLVCDHVSGDFAFAPFLAELRPQLPALENLVFLGAPDDGADHRWEELAATPADPDAIAAAGAVLPEDPAVILYTSGTTGEPKGAVLTHRSLLASARAQAERFGQSADDVVLGALPFNHVGGLTCGFGAALVSGGALAVLPRFVPEDVLATMASAGVTLMLGVPTMYTLLLSADGFSPDRVGAVRRCVVGGSNVEPALAARIVEAFGGAGLSNLYGLSETSGACIISAPDDSLETVSTTIGTALGDFSARIVDPSGEPVACGGTGELQIRGDCVADGYWQMPEETRAAFLTDGWLATGDMGVMTEDGHIALHGRSKEMYVRGGYNVYPAEIENVLGTHPSVAMCAVIGYPDETFGQKGCAFIVPVPGTEVDRAALLDLCRRMLADYKIPDRIEIVDELPMTPAGKIRKYELRVDHRA